MTGFHLALLFAGCVMIAAAFVANRFVPGHDAESVREAAVSRSVAVEV